MKNYEALKIELRPSLELPIEEAKPIEKFQSLTLRPILKLQYQVLILLFQAYLKKRKATFYKMNDTDKLSYIQNALKKDAQFKQLMIGTIIGLFTVTELNEYLLNESEINKRITTMLIQRLQSNLELL